MRLVRLTDPDALAAFARGQAEAYAGRPLANDHPVRADELVAYDRVMGLVDDHGALLGGYVVNLTPRRTWAALSEGARHAVGARMDVTRDAAEIVCVWKRRAIDRRTFALRVWAPTIVQLLSLPRRYIFGMAYRAHGLDGGYRRFRPVIVQDGAHANDLRVFYFTRAGYAVTAVVGIALHLVGIGR